MPDADPFMSSIMARAAGFRVVVAAVMAACLWGAIWWAVSLP